MTEQKIQYFDVEGYQEAIEKLNSYKYDIAVHIMSSNRIIASTAYSDEAHLLKDPSILVSTLILLLK